MGYRVSYSEVGNAALMQETNLTQAAKYLVYPVHGLLNRWTSQLDLGITTEGLERVFSVHKST